MYLRSRTCTLIDDKGKNIAKDSAYVYIIEIWIFALLLLGVLVMDGWPVLPTVVTVGLLVCVLCMSIGLLGITVGFVNNKSFILGDASSIVLSMMQVSMEHAFGLIANFAVFFVAVTSSSNEAADAYFAILFRANVEEPDLWYLTRTAIIILLALQVVLLFLLLACFGILRRCIPGIDQKRAHFMGFIHSFILFNVAVEYMMRASNVRVCQKLYPCDLSTFTQDPNIDFMQHFNLVLILVGFAVLDMICEICYGRMRLDKTPYSIAIVLIIAYSICRFIMLGAVCINYFLIQSPDDVNDDIFALWFRLLIICGYGLAIIFELTVGAAEAHNVHKFPLFRTRTRMGGFSAAKSL